MNRQRIRFRENNKPPEENHGRAVAKQEKRAKGNTILYSLDKEQVDRHAECSNKSHSISFQVHFVVSHCEARESHDTNKSKKTRNPKEGTAWPFP